MTDKSTPRSSHSASTNSRYGRAIAAAAKKAADSIERLPLDDEVRKLKKRGLLREDLVVDAINFSRRSLVAAVERGLSEQHAASSQESGLAQWRALSDAAKKATKSLDDLIKRSKFKIGELQVLSTKQKHAVADFPGSSAAGVLTALRREAHGAAKDLHQSVIAARLAAANIADQAKLMADDIAKLKHDPGEPFRRGFTIEMMKTWWLLTGRSPSSKRSEVGNPFAAFADAGLQSISADPDLPSCVGVVRSALVVFHKLQEGGAFDSLLDDITPADG
jgi:hypothetical protein